MTAVKQSRVPKRGPSIVKLIVSLSSLVIAAASLAIGSYAFLNNSDNFQDRVKYINHDSSIETLTPPNFDSFPAFIKAMPLRPRDLDDDSNGLRDDLQIYIAYKYPNDAVARSALIQLASITDKMTTVHNRTRIDKVAVLLHEEQGALRCFYDRNFDESDLIDLRNKVFNKASKKMNYELAIKRRNEIPDTLKFAKPKEPCDLLLLGNERSLQEWTP